MTPEYKFISTLKGDIEILESKKDNPVSFENFTKVIASQIRKYQFEVKKRMKGKTSI